MEFHEKLQELRKRRGLTQEELAEALYVSRTAVSKWESGRGYPSIDSLKEISRYFSVTIDDLLSGETLISIAETENKRNIQNLFDLLFGMTDLLSVLLIVLPLYPRTVEGYIYSVNLFEYTETSVMNRFLYWMLILGLILLGAWKVLTVQLKMEKDQKIIQKYSLTLSIAAVVVLALAGETYAVTVAFLLLVMKTVVFCKYLKSGC
ncbi:MAG: helix-turn-helix transcriptional regulator [Lachnoclostridium sp.]|nr:helix-turn-helix transcriptional regulator [Lachnoclostridium sp.]